MARDTPVRHQRRGRRRARRLVGQQWLGTNGPLTLRNVTAVATGTGSYGIRADANGNNTNLDISARNVIASGHPGRHPLDARPVTSSDSDVDPELLQLRHRSRRAAAATSATSGSVSTNQTAPPVFADDHATTRRWARPRSTRAPPTAASAPTTSTATSRRVGAAVDIGADEFDPTPPPGRRVRHASRGARPASTRRSSPSTPASRSTFNCIVDKKAPRCVPVAVQGEVQASAASTRSR